MAAMFGAALVGAQFVAGQATRNALFLDHFEPRSLPPLIIATSVFSILLVVVGSRMLRRVAPSTYVPVGFAASAVLILAEWGFTFALPGLAARIVYLQVCGLGPMLGSGFWLIASERFDPLFYTPLAPGTNAPSKPPSMSARTVPGTSSARPSFRRSSGCLENARCPRCWGLPSQARLSRWPSEPD
jgi:hypothetical protein